MFLTKAFFEVTDRAATDNDEAAIGGIGDYVQNGHHVLARDGRLMAAISMGISSSRVRIDAPALRMNGAQLDLWPFERAAIPSEYSNICDMRADSPFLSKEEEIIIKHSGNGTTGTNENWTTILFIGDGNLAVPQGNTLQLQLTGTTTLVANAWTNVNLTPSETLRQGVYEIIGLAAYSAGGQAARLRFQGAPEAAWTPGCVCSNTNLGVVPSFMFWNGGMGSFGRYQPTAPPSIEFLSNSADTAETVWMRLLRIS